MADEERNEKQIVYTIENKLKKVESAEFGEAAVAFEDALDMTGVGRYNYTLFCISNMMLLAMALETFGTSYVVTASNCDLEMSTETKGLVGAMPALGLVIFSHLWGYLADTRGRRKVLIVSMSGCFVGSIICSFSNSWLVLAIFKFISACFASASNSVTFAMFGESTPRFHRNKLVMLMSSGLMCAQALMTVIAYPILRQDFDLPLFGIRYRPWRLLEQAYGAFSGVSLLMLWLLTKESPKFFASMGRDEESIKVLSEMFALNTGRKPEDFPVKKLLFLEQKMSTKKTNVLQSMLNQTTPLFRGPLLFRTLILCYIVILVYAIPPAFLMWMPTITTTYSLASANGLKNSTFCQLLHASTIHNLNSTLVTPQCVDKVEDLAFITLFSFSIATALVNGLNSWLIKYVGKRALVIFFHLLAGICGLCLPLIYNTDVALIIFFLFQSNLIAMGLTTGFTVEIYPTYLRAMAVCLTMMVGRAVSFLVISYIGVLLENHCDTAFYAFGGFVLSGAAVGALLPAEVRRDRDKAAGSGGALR